MFRRLLFAAALLLAGGVAQADCSGPVLRVADGDSLHVSCDGQDTTVRLQGIDAPEWRQAYGRRAKKELAALVEGRELRLLGSEIDSYGRLLATAWLGDLNINREMARRGYAWAYRRYLHDPALLDDEAQARQQRLGLWADPQPVPPWEFRPPPWKRRQTLH
ncbi:MAG TPA: thermonuclease family protein [Solimonas sp.]|nr:thermonuclease family protein [Solimonas sp.]